MADALTGGVPDAAVAGERRTSLGAWSARNTDIAQVVSALDDLRQGEQRAATRTSVVNLVVVAADQDDAQRAAAAMRRLGSRHPGRTLVLSCQSRLGTGLDADVSLHQASAAGRTVWWDEVALSVRGRLCEHLDSLVEPLLLPELPLAAWYVSELPRPGAPLPSVADAIVVDARAARHLDDPADTGGGGGEAVGPVRLGGLTGLVELTRRHPVVDLSWVRLEPWRRALAHLFDPPDLRPFVTGVIDVEVAGRLGPRTLLAGWLVDCLGLVPSSITLRRDVHAAMTLRASAGGRQATFSVERHPDDRLVRSRAIVDGVAVLKEALVQADDALSWSLARALTHLERDPVYDHAIHAALGLAASPPAA
ncbi:MAG: hypothetical protein DLM54_01220 [Acidimicrobiales bacterium]|nr:MAG: hypothetical protein DLM54_01220 [Acidimicrobiales bacterium]